MPKKIVVVGAGLGADPAAAVEAEAAALAVLQAVIPSSSGAAVQGGLQAVIPSSSMGAAQVLSSL